MSTFSSPKFVSHPLNHRRRHHHHHQQRHHKLNRIRCCLPPQSLYSLSYPSRRSLLFLSTSLSLPSSSDQTQSQTETETETPPSPPPDTTITDRVYLDFSICPSYILSQPQQLHDSPLCSDSEPLGRVVLGLYGKLVPITVSNFKSMCTSSSGSSYKNTLIHKLLPGQFFVGGHQGRKDKGEVAPPLKLTRNTESVESRAFLLKHSRPGVVSLCLSENDDDDDIKLDPDYHNVEFLITTGPGPCPNLDGRNIIFGSVLEGMDVVTSIASTPTYKPAEKIRQLNDLASFFGDERASNARTSWNRPLKTVYISDCGELQVSKPSLSPSLP